MLIVLIVEEAVFQDAGDSPLNRGGFAMSADHLKRLQTNREVTVFTQNACFLVSEWNRIEA